jgi:outer membrane protein assembly factor BamB
VWKRQAYADSSPSAANGVVYIYGRRDTQIRLVAIDEATGTTLWKAGLGSPNLYSFTGGASIANGVVYATSLAGAVAAFDASDGTLLWRYDSVGASSGMAIVADGKVYVATLGHRMHAFGL